MSKGEGPYSARILRARFKIPLFSYLLDVLFSTYLAFHLTPANIDHHVTGRTPQQNARRLRREQTDAERILWRHLRGRRTRAVKFRRQHPIGIYIADFCAIERRLVIELDGGQHADQSQEDEARTAFLKSRDYRVLRFWNDQVLNNIAEVLNTIDQILSVPPEERRTEP